MLAVLIQSAVIQSVSEKLLKHMLAILIILSEQKTLFVKDSLTM